MKYYAILGALAGALLSVSSAQAAVICEYDGQGVCPAGSAMPSDFNGATGTPTITVIEDTTVLGFVAHRLDNKYRDGWSMDFGSSVYSTTFDWTPTSANVDGELIVNGTSVYSFSTETTPLGETVTLGNLTGLVTFLLDPVLGSFGNNPDETMYWQLDVSEVPLPAGAWLILSGLGGLALVRRKTA